MLLTNILPSGKHSREYFGAFAGGLTELAGGLALGWYSPTSVHLREYYELTDEEAENIPNLPLVFQASCLLGIIGSGIFSSVYGRKFGMMFVNVPYMLGIIPLFFLSGIWPLYINRVLAGYTFGGLFSVVPSFICEITTPTLRGTLTSMTSVMLQIGFLFEYVVIPSTTFKWNLAISLGICLVAILMVSQVRESPYWLLNKGKLAACEASLVFYRNTMDVDGEMKRMTVALDEERQRQPSYWDLVKIPTNRKALLLVLYVFFIQQATGSNVLIQNSQEILSKYPSSISVDISGVIYSATNIVFGFLVSPLTETFGRKPLLLVSNCCQGIPVFLLGLFFQFRYTGVTNFFSDIDALPLILMVLFNLSYAIGGMTVPYSYMTEMFPTSVRSQASVVVSLYGSFMGLVMLAAYRFCNGNFAPSIVFFVFAALAFANTLVGVFVLPETKGLSLEEIQRRLRT